MAEEEETKLGAIPVSALQMAIQIQLRVDAVVVDHQRRPSARS